MGKRDTKERHSLRIGKVFGGFSNVASVFSWFGIPASVVLGVLRRS